MEKYCSFCKDGTMAGIEEAGPEGVYELIHTTGRNFQMGYSEYIEAEFEFIYCPMCGRRLEDETKCNSKQI